MTVLALLLPLASAIYLPSHHVSVTLISQSPDPVEPGQVVKLKFKIENEGTQTNEDVIVKINPKFPFSIYGDETEKNIGKLPASTTGGDAINFEFRVKVDEKAAEGDAEIELDVKIGNGGVSYTDDEFLIDIQTHDAVLDIASITMEPEQVPPGQTAEVSFLVKNLADSLLKDIRFKLNFAGDLPLAPYKSSSERILSQLGSGQQNTLNFKIIASPDATTGLYKVPLNITFNDEKGNAVSMDDIVAVSVGGKPKVHPFIKKSSVLQSNKEGTITLGIANAGATDVKFVELTLLPSDHYRLISTSDYVYIGDIDSDDTESEEFLIFINKKADGKRIETLQFPVRLKYLDANNREFQQQFDLKLNLFSSGELKKFGVLESNHIWAYILLLILIVGGYVYYKKYYKKD